MKIDLKKFLINALPFIIIGLFTTKLGQAYRLSDGIAFADKLKHMDTGFALAFQSFLPSFHPFDLMIGAACGGIFKTFVYFKGKNAKKFRKDVEYGSARWGTPNDIKPYIDPKPENNIILTATESLTMNSRPKPVKFARNKNVLVIGGSGSGKTRFFVKPNLMQCQSKDYPVSFVCTDPKGTILNEVGKLLQKNGYRIKVLNTIDFKKSMKYNPFAYIHSEKDILKFVTALIKNTSGEQKGGDEFWTKSEQLLYQALIGYIYYEAPPYEKNMNTLVEMINSMEVREDDENFKNAIDFTFEALEERDPQHFAVRQYKKFKLAAGVVSCRRLIYQIEGKLMNRPFTAYFLCAKGARQHERNQNHRPIRKAVSR